ncbi:Rpn family recombination-promoting nuclease/putative transposase [uncultured Mailhella sp.]|uniref:Rpn family recombination-promoting nuclease/putative transposase n=1 Tax=uncultured Mailhella sp. TaxID=1981031 RepID=UPI00262221EC|nr:Rpn family recombination-promoting nuclease/putative transposase [uncultured Mailhella sp.]
MEHERLPHDPAYKQLFSNPVMVESLLRELISADFIDELDFSTLERCASSYVTDDLRERHDDIVWRVGWKNGAWCYVVLLLEFQSTPDHWMALRILSYTSLLLLDLVKTGRIKENEGLPPVFPIVIYNGSRPWKAPREVEELFAPMPGGLKAYCPSHRHFLLDESSVPEDKLEAGSGPASMLVRLEQAKNLEQVREVVKELAQHLQAPEYLDLRRAFTVWLGRIVLKRSGITEEIPEFQDLREVDAMLEERAAQWKNEYIQRGESRGLGIALRDLLEMRFGSLPSSVLDYIENSSDIDALRRLTLDAARAESLNAFMSQLGLPVASC